MANVIEIPATKSYFGHGAKRVLNVGAYARVSTEAEQQAKSFETQVEHYTKLIKETPGWKFVDVYGDEGISGTSIYNRPEFQRMMNDCRKGRLDLIIIKSVSRFGRNSAESLQCIRELKDLGVGVIFEKEGINTLNYTTEMFIALHTIFAQAESESMSENIKMGRSYRYREGKCCYNFNGVYGFSQDAERNISVEIGKAINVRFIFDCFIKGMSIEQIVNALAEREIPSPRGKERWSPGSVERILKNEKYAGDVLTSKTLTLDPISKKKVKNTGQAPQYYIRDHHPPIVERELFDSVQEEISRRGCIKKFDKKQSYGKYSGKFPYNDLIFCGECGAKYRRTEWKTRSGDKKYVWRCLNRIQNGQDCCQHSPSINNNFMDEITLEAINTIYTSRKRVKDILKSSIASLLGDTEQPKISANTEKLNLMSDRVREAIYKNANGEISPDELDRICLEVKMESQRLRQENKEYEMERKMKSTESSKLKLIFKAIDGMDDKVCEIDTPLIRSIIERYEVVSKKKMIIWFIGDIPYEVDLPE